MTENHHIQAVLFDLGSTLIYFDAAWPEVVLEMNQALLKALHEAGYNDLDQGFILDFRARLREVQSQADHEFREFTMGDLLSGLLQERGYPAPDDRAILNVLKSMFAVSEAHWKAEPDAIPTLELLRRRGYRLAIVSNAGDDADVQMLIDNAGIRPYFDYIITSAAAGVRKPNPRIFNMALEALGIGPHQAVMIGDLLEADVLGAHNAGLPGIWISRRASPNSALAHDGTIVPDAEIKTLAELPEVLEKLAVR